MSSTIAQTSDSPWKEAGGGSPEFSNQISPQNLFVSPNQEGTASAFGGNIGLSNVPLNQQGVPTLPTMPYLQYGNQPDIGTQNTPASQTAFGFQHINKTPWIIGDGLPGISSGPTNLNSLPGHNAGLSSRIDIPKETVSKQNRLRSGSTSILNNDTTFNYTDFNTVLLSESQNRLKHLGNQANRHLLQIADNQIFYNLSLSEIVDHTILTVIAIFSDLLETTKPDQVEKRKYMNYNEITREYANIFIREDRMIYIGVFMINMSLLFMVIFLSS